MRIRAFRTLPLWEREVEPKSVVTGAFCDADRNTKCAGRPKQSTQTLRAALSRRHHIMTQRLRRPCDSQRNRTGKSGGFMVCNWTGPCASWAMTLASPAPPCKSPASSSACPSASFSANRQISNSAQSRFSPEAVHLDSRISSRQAYRATRSTERFLRHARADGAGRKEASESWTRIAASVFRGLPPPTCGRGTSLCSSMSPWLCLRCLP